jgi:hypothetical protein
LSEKESVKTDEQKAESQESSERKRVARFTGENKKVTAKLNEQEEGPRKSRGKKQRRQHKLDPNRG